MVQILFPFCFLLDEWISSYLTIRQTLGLFMVTSLS